MNIISEWKKNNPSNRDKKFVIDDNNEVHYTFDDKNNKIDIWSILLKILIPIVIIGLVIFIL